MQLAFTIARRLRDAGFEAWFVGGCVRDELLGRPVKDIDIATSARPEQVLALFPGANQAGAHFGVILVRDRADQIEVATFRSDGDYTDGRHPDGVKFETSPREDALRRDFTINALFRDPFTGEVLDFSTGLADLQAGVIRTVGNPHQRFAEDHLRLLRAVRFAARLEFTIDPETMRAIQELAGSIHKVSVERIRDELARILTEGGARRGFELLDESGLLREILPEVAAMKGVEQPAEFHPEGDVWIHTLMMLEGLKQPTLSLALGVLLHDVGKPPTFRIADRIRFDGHVEKGVEMTRAMLGRLRFPNNVIDQAVALVENHMKFRDAVQMRESRLKRFIRMEAFEEHMELHRLDCLSSHGSLEYYNFIQAKQKELPVESLRPAPLITGRDLIEAGFNPGPGFGRALREVEDAQMDNRIATREEALEMARAVLAS